MMNDKLIKANIDLVDKNRMITEDIIVLVRYICEEDYNKKKYMLKEVKPIIKEYKSRFFGGGKYK